MKNYQSKSWLQEMYYEQHFTLSQMAKAGMCCPRTIVNWMNRYGLKRRDPASSRWPDRPYTNGAWLREKYLDEKLHQHEIAKLCQVTQSAIATWLAHFDIPCREGGRRLYSVNTDLFASWTHESAYVLGLLATDGSVDKRERTVTFKSTDLELVESIHKLMGNDTSRPIFQDKYVKGKVYHRVLISSTLVVSQLKALGITPQKTLTLEWPAIPPLFLSSFVSGVLDGDGCVYYGHSSSSNAMRLMAIIGMCAEHFMNGLVTSTRSHLNIKGSYSCRKFNIDRWHPHYRFSLEGIAAMKFLDWIYTTPCPHLARKQQKYHSYLNWASSNLTGSGKPQAWRNQVLLSCGKQPLLTGFPINS